MTIATVPASVPSALPRAFALMPAVAAFTLAQHHLAAVAVLLDTENIARAEPRRLAGFAGGLHARCDRSH